ncbi:MAG: DUF4185 domain-containing protein [Thermodesulfobacteriota bacterium]
MIGFKASRYRRRLILPALMLLALLLLGLGGRDIRFAIVAEPWPEADSLFHRDPRWLGADDAYSVDLGRGRVLWLFGDTFIAEIPGQGRREARFIRNSVAIQQGYDPTSAGLRFYWGRRDGRAASFFGESGPNWFWPGHGVRLKDRLLIFLMEICPGAGPLGFEGCGWAAAMIANPDDEPDQWRTRRLEVPANGFRVLVGSAGVIEHDGHIYAFGAQEPGGRRAFLVRWPLARVLAEDLSRPEWWTGDRTGWQAQDRLENEPPPVFTEAQNEFTVHYDRRLKLWLQIQTMGFGAADLAARWAPALTGPWFGPEKFYRPGESGRPGILVYAGKAHPELTGAGLVLTYVANSLNEEAVLNDEGLYYPRFLKAEVKPVQ